MKSTQRTNQQRPDQSNLGMILLAFLLLSVGWILCRPNSSSRADLRSIKSGTLTEPELDQKAILNKINLHMQMVERQREFNAIQAEVENIEFGSTAQPDNVGETPVPGPSINAFESENSAAKVYRDLMPNDRKFDNPALPTDRINTMVEQDQWIARFEQKTKEDYVKRFKESARLSGYAIEIDKQMQVKSIQRIPNQALPTGSK